MAKKKPTLLSNSMQYGAMTGVALFIIFLIINLAGLGTRSVIQQILSYGILITGIVIGTKSYREHVLGGRLKYSQGLGSGTMISLFCAILISFFTFLYLKFVDDSMIDVILKETKDDMIAKGYTDEQIDMGMKYVPSSPMSISIIGVISYTIMGFVISLISSAFLKKDNGNFEDFVAENQ